MGMYNSIYVSCPKCDNLIEFQSKSGSCDMSSFDISKVPEQDLKGIIGDMRECDECGHVVEIEDPEIDYLDGSSLVK